MRNALPKVLHPLCGRTMLGWVVEQALGLEPERIVLVVGHGADEVVEHGRELAGDVPLEVRVQEPQLGTGHALQVAADAIPSDAQRVVVLYGDMPLLGAESLERLVAEQAAGGAGASALLTARFDNPPGYGRILRDAQGVFEAIVEQKDATPEQRLIDEVNLGVYSFDGATLLENLPRLTNDNAQGEYYLTDLLGLAVAAGKPVRVVTVEDTSEGQGVNTLSQLADARSSMQMRILEGHLAAGVQIEDPNTTFIGCFVTIGAGTKIFPCTLIEGEVAIGEGCEVGPFARLRTGTVLEDGAQIGNFTECKQTTMGPGSKAKHLTYLGNTQVGARANIGAGTIFANYDGTHKHTTVVGERAFIGSGTIIVAPNEIAAGCTTGAGAVVTRKARTEQGETWVGMPARRLRTGDSKSQTDPDRDNR
ncbi:MAG: bifunctional UDP-N-acetylglucosamine pyrophosphorylase/glucosamine-1-phosphate N-acetyltransferase [Planctomycetota bacterium]|jgi:bifunctional UDP-N-acetylglucosamine pyrophosphorylase/glucosamine-1-phosphate N-acetyltransferase